MNFEHLIEINDPTNPLLTPLSRHQLWQGLVMRAEHPELSSVALDACIILARAPNYLRREMHFGKLRVHDEVFLDPLNEVRYMVAASDSYPASQLVMRIDEPATGHLFLRFIYSSEAENIDEMLREHLKQVYIAADMDTTSVIRELAAQGKLGAYAEDPPQDVH
jgi:hypothetical protein